MTESSVGKVKWRVRGSEREREREKKGGMRENGEQRSRRGWKDEVKECSCG